MAESRGRRSKWSAGIVLGPLLVVLTSCGGSGAPNDAGDGTSSTVTIGMASEPQGLDPQLREDGFMRPITANIFEALVDRNADSKYVPELAESWEQVDERTWRFKLRPDVTFQNGEPLNSDAVVFSIERQIDPAFNSELLSYFTPIVEAEAVDELTVDVKTDSYDPALVGRMYWLRIVPPEYTAESSAEDLAASPIGTGPYRFEEWERGQQITLTANGDYWGGKPSVSKMVFRFISEGSQRLQGLNAGEIDVATALLPDQAAEAATAVSVPGFEHGFIRLNALPGSPLESVELRQAMNYAIDKQTLADELFKGYAEVENAQLVSEHVFGYNPGLEPYPFDPDKARRLVQESGYDGEALEIVTTDGRWPLTKQMCEAIAEMLGDVGINTTVRVVEFGPWLDAIFDLDNPPAMIHISETNEIGDPLRTIGNYYTTDGQLSSWHNADADSLVAEAADTDNQDRRAEVYQDVFALGREDAMAIFLLRTDDIYGISDRITWEPRMDQFILGAEMAVN